MRELSVCSAVHCRKASCTTLHVYAQLGIWKPRRGTRDPNSTYPCTVDSITRGSWRWTGWPQWVRGMVGYDVGAEASIGEGVYGWQRGGGELYWFTYLYVRALENPGQLPGGWAHQPVREGCMHQQGLRSLTLRVLFCGIFFSPIVGRGRARDSLSSLCRTASAPLRYAIYNIDAEYTITYT